MEDKSVLINKINHLKFEIVSFLIDRLQKNLISTEKAKRIAQSVLYKFDAIKDENTLATALDELAKNYEEIKFLVGKKKEQQEKKTIGNIQHEIATLIAQGNTEKAKELLSTLASNNY